MPYIPAGGTRPEDLTPNNLQPVGRVMNSVENDNLYDRPIPEQMDVYARHKSYKSLALIFRMMGSVKGCSNPTFGHYEEPWKDDLVKVNTIVTASGGAGNDMVVSLTSDSMYNTGGSQGGSARQTSFVLQNDLIKLPNGKSAQVVSKNVTVTPHRLTLRPGNAAEDLDGNVVAGGQYFIYGNANAEGSGHNGMRLPRYMKYQNTFIIIKTKWGATGTERTNKVYQEVLPGVQGGMYLRLADDAQYYHDRAIDGVFMFGEQFDNLTAYDSAGLNLDLNIAGTEGLDAATSVASPAVTPTLATYSVNDLDNIVKALENERSTDTNSMIGLTGSEIHLARENSLQEFTNQNLAPFFNMMALNHGGWDFSAVADTDEYKGLSYAFGLHSIQKGAVTLNYKKFPMFSDVKMAGALDSLGDAIYGYPKLTIYLPLGAKVTTSTAKAAPACGYEYKSLDGLNRHLLINTMYGAGTKQGEVSHERDYMEGFVTSELAPHFYCLNQFVREQGA